MRVPYIVGAGEAFGEPARSHRIRSSILSCSIGAGIGIGLRLVVDSNPEIIAGILSTLEALETAVWNMLCNVAHACAEFVRNVMRVRLG
jgi:hypothetical protein